MNRIIHEITDGISGFLGFSEKINGCFSCGESCVGVDLLCRKCSTQLIPLSGDSCVRCGRYLDWKVGTIGTVGTVGTVANGLLCPRCASVKTSFDLVISCYEYNGLCKELLHRLKYSNERELAAVFGRKMGDTMGEVLFENSGKLYENSILIPVPISKDKMETRGYNQALCLAEKVGKISGIKVVDGLLRIKDTQGQHKLTKIERNENIKGAFSFNFKYNIFNRHAILVDDIFTTGSTAEECAKALKQAGAARVTVLTAAGGGRKSIL